MTRNNRYRGNRRADGGVGLNRRPASQAARVAQNQNNEQDDQITPTPPRVATPPLTEAVPDDTPRFADLAGQNVVDPVLIKTITEDLKFDHMMPVQAATLHELLPPARSDALVQAKTGTGKTVAFLLPAIQTMLSKKRAVKGAGISLLVISPTRELAMQIQKEANNLLQRIPGYDVALAIGGTNKGSESRNILGGCAILVATPGRLIDHLSDENIKDCFQDLDTLVLDEADRLLDMGFLSSLKEVVSHLPDKVVSQRQGMLFSATIAPHVQQVGKLVLSPGYKFISTIPAGEANTHERVPQHLVTVPTFSDMAPAIVGAVRQEMAHVGPQSFKAIVFAQTAAQADFYGHVLSSMSGIRKVAVLHSRLSQGRRTANTTEFRDAKNGILVATDVVARGMDFPGVTTVFQCGVPLDKESYIHRLGRTARAGAEGRGFFIVTEPESYFPKYSLKEITFIPHEADLSATQEVQAVCVNMDEDKIAKVYQAWLGFYKTLLKPMRWDAAELVAQANIYAKSGLGAASVPSIAKSTVGKMGLRGTPGLIVVPDPPKAPRGGGGEGRSKGSGGKGKVDADAGPADGAILGRASGSGGAGGGDSRGGSGRSSRGGRKGRGKA